MDRAKAFYVEKVGFNLDVDVMPGGELRIVQMTPPGSACSITIGTGITDAAPAACGERIWSRPTSRWRAPSWPSAVLT